jgi:hypothetical protein
MVWIVAPIGPDGPALGAALEAFPLLGWPPPFGAGGVA